MTGKHSDDDSPSGCHRCAIVSQEVGAETKQLSRYHIYLHFQLWNDESSTFPLSKW